MNENRSSNGTSARRSLWLARALCLSVLALVLFGPAAASRCAAQGPDMPIQFKMIGQFYDPKKNPEAGGVNAFTVNIDRKTLIFNIDNSYTLHGSVLGSTILLQIYPPIMTFTGPRELTDQLTDPAIEGKTCTLNGRLFLRARVFRIHSVQGPKDEEPADSGAAKPDPGT